MSLYRFSHACVTLTLSLSLFACKAVCTAVTLYSRLYVSAPSPTRDTKYMWNRTAATFALPSRGRSCVPLFRVLDQTVTSDYTARFTGVGRLKWGSFLSTTSWPHRWSKFMRGSAGFWCLRMQALQERAVGIKGGKRERAWATAPRAPSRKLPANSGFREVKPNRTWARPTELGHVPHLSIGTRCVYQ